MGRFLFCKNVGHDVPNGLGIQFFPFYVMLCLIFFLATAAAAAAAVYLVRYSRARVCVEVCQ